ncbi:MAG: hypothetical protein AB1630_13130 [bacterium]
MFSCFYQFEQFKIPMPNDKQNPNDQIPMTNKINWTFLVRALDLKFELNTYNNRIKVVAE